MIRTVLRREEGVALPVAAGVLLVLSILIVALAGNAMQSTGAANKDRNSKRALGAAEAGLQIANYRLNGIQAMGNKCFTNGPVNPDPTTGECPPIEVDLGNGAKATYHVTQALEAGDACGSVPGQLDSGTERCITATGEVNGVKRRVQTRVLTTPISPPLLQVEGITALKRIEIGNNAQSGGNIGSNEEISIGNNGVVPFVEFGNLDGVLSARKIETEGSTIYRTEPFTLRLPEIEGTELPCPDVPMRGCNNNGILSSSDGYQAGTRDLKLTQDLVLPSGDYNFCRLEFAGGGLRAESGGNVRIFIDAPDHPDGRLDSDCPTGGNPAWGGIDGKNGISIGQPDDPPENIEIYVYGWPSTSQYATQYGRSSIQVGKNNLEANAFIYAPQSYVYVAKNDLIMNGAVAAEEVFVKNNMVFNWDDDLKWVGFSSGRYDRQGWRECRDEPTNAADPESGC